MNVKKIKMNLVGPVAIIKCRHSYSDGKGWNYYKLISVSEKDTVDERDGLLTIMELGMSEKTYPKETKKFLEAAKFVQSAINEKIDRERKTLL